MRFDIELFFDTLCPWCYVGKKNLDSAMVTYKGLHPDAEFNLIWRPFVLYPKAPPTAISKKTPFNLMFGLKATHYFKQLELAGAAHGIRFKWDGTTGSSIDSHKLILRAMEFDALAARQQQISTTELGLFHPSAYISPPDHHQFQPGLPTTPPTARPTTTGARRRSKNSSTSSSRGSSRRTSSTSTTPAATTSSFIPPSTTPNNNNALQDATIMALFKGHNEDGRDISDRGFLVETAIALGLAADEIEALAVLDSEVATVLVVDVGAARAAEVGVSAVPNFVVQGRYKVGGCQGPEVFLGLFERMQRMEEGLSDATGLDATLVKSEPWRA